MVFHFLRHVAILSVLVLAGPSLVFAEPQTFVFDRQHTNVSFAWNHLGMSRQSGRILDVEGSLLLNPERPDESKIDVTMKAQSIMTGVAELDRDLKGPDYFDVSRHPLITFRSTEVMRTGEKTAVVTGDLTILGVSRPVALSVSLNFMGEHPLGPLNANYQDKFAAGFSARAKISRSEWGLKRGTPLVSDAIEIAIEAELIRK